MIEEQELDEEELKQRVLTYHQENVSMMLNWAGIEEERAIYLADYQNVVQDLNESPSDDWALLRAAMLHIACSETLNLEHNRWLGKEIFASFEKEARHTLHYLTLVTRRDRPVPMYDSQEMYFGYQITAREATYYYCRAALAVLVSGNDPNQAIELFEDLNSLFVPRIRYLLPGCDYNLHIDRELDRLPLLFERVGRFEDALRFTSVSFTHFGRNAHPADVAVRRLDGWLDQLSASGGVSQVERCLDMIYEWMDKASDVDDEERDYIGECPTTTRQFWAWYYGNALGRLLVVRPSLRESLLDEIEAEEWDNCWHVAAVLVENPPGTWEHYRERALKFYNTSEIEYSQHGSRPWGATQPPHMNPQSDLYWAIRVGFADAHSEKTEERSVSRAGLVDSLEELKAISSSTAQHMLRTERNTDIILEDVKYRVPPNHEYWYGLLQNELSVLASRLPRATIDHLVDAYRYRYAKEWDYCKVSLCKSVESLFLEVLGAGIQALPEYSELTLAFHIGKKSPRKLARKDWGKISLSRWSQILSTCADEGINQPLRLALPLAFPNVDVDSVADLNVELAAVAQLRNSAAHHSAAVEERKAVDAGELWDLVVGSKGEGFLHKFYAAFGLDKDG